MIVITGATGNLGSQVVNSILQGAGGERIAVSVRDPNKAEALAAKGVRVREGDFTKPETLLRAFEGATQVFIISSGAQARGGDPLIQHQNAISAAVAVGARRILYTAHQAASSTSAFQPMHVHAATEKMLHNSGVAWTSLRNGFYASRALQESSSALKTGRITAPADGKVSWTSHSDLAAAAAAILLQEGIFEGPTPPLTGSEALDFSDIAAILSDLLNKEVTREVIPDEALPDLIAARSAPCHNEDFQRLLRSGTRRRIRSRQPDP